MLEDHRQDIAFVPMWVGGGNFCPLRENGGGVAGAPPATKRKVRIK